jgi:hypothetical protein
MGHDQTAYRAFRFLGIHFQAIGRQNHNGQTDAFWKVCMVSVFTPNKIEHNFVKVVRMNSSVFPANGIFHGAQLQPFSLLQFLPRSKLH